MKTEVISSDEQSINAKRFLARFAQISCFGAADDGSIDRQALSQADVDAHLAVIDWFKRPGYQIEADAIGNIFITRSGTDSFAAPVVSGSHLDSQPRGGCFDGALGIVAAAEVLASFDDRSIVTRRPVQLAIWMNEEGCRFSPVTMGSAVFTGMMSLDEAKAVTDPSGKSFAKDLELFFQKLDVRPGKSAPAQPRSYLEVHIEQGPVLESEGCIIGVVTGVQGTVQYRVDVEGREGHAGTTPLSLRMDAFKAARMIITRFDEYFENVDETTRFTIGRCNIKPSTPNTIPGSASFTIDLRHPCPSSLEQHDAFIHETIQDWEGPCHVRITKLISVPPVQFDPNLVDAIDTAATQRGMMRRRLISGATHDAARIANLCPTAMIFVPCRDGLSHCPEEFASEADMLAGVSVLRDVVLAEAQAE